MNKWSVLEWYVVSLVSAIIAITPLAHAHEDSLNVFVYAILGPLKSNPTYQSWSTNMVWKLYRQGNLDSDDIGYRLLTEQVSQPADLSSNTLWFAVKITSKDMNVMSALSRLKFTSQSYDATNNTLGNTYDLSVITNLIYSPRALGVIWNPNGPRVSDTILDYGDGNTPVHEIDFIGMQSVYYPYSTTNGYAAIDNYIHGFTNGFFLNARCVVLDTNQTVIALGQKTLRTKGDPIAPILTIGYDPQSVWVGALMETNVTMKLYTSATMQPPSWSFVSTMNANDIHYLPKTNFMGYFRAQLE